MKHISQVKTFMAVLLNLLQSTLNLHLQAILNVIYGYVFKKKVAMRANTTKITIFLS
jgi:hypothetical protein